MSNIIPIIVVGVLIFTFLPIWRVGNEKNLNFWGLTLRHTIFGNQIRSNGWFHDDLIDPHESKVDKA